MRLWCELWDSFLHSRDLSSIIFVGPRILEAWPAGFGGSLMWVPLRVPFGAGALLSFLLLLALKFLTGAAHLLAWGACCGVGLLTLLLRELAYLFACGERVGFFALFG